MRVIISVLMISATQLFGVAKETEAAEDQKVTVRQLQAIMPNAREPVLLAYLPYLNDSMKQAGIRTGYQKAAFIATIAYESCELMRMEEIASGYSYNWRKDLGNVYPGDGPRFKGRGPIQLTGRWNYRTYGRMINAQLETRPWLASRPDIGFRISAVYWKSNGLADQSNFILIVRAINPRMHGLKRRMVYWHRALMVLN